MTDMVLKVVTGKEFGGGQRLEEGVSVPGPVPSECY